jgi:hypothetical protein
LIWNFEVSNSFSLFQGNPDATRKTEISRAVKAFHCFSHVTVFFLLETERLPPKWPLFVCKCLPYWSLKASLGVLGSNSGMAAAGIFPEKTLPGCVQDV